MRVSLEPVVVPATLEHAFVLAATMRPKDVAEVRETGLEPLEAALQSLRCSESAWALLYDDVVAAMFGVCPMDTGEVLGRREVGQLWFLTAHSFSAKPIAFFKVAKRVVAALLTRYELLANVIDVRYSEAQRFAQALGAEFLSPVPVGPNGSPFIPFRIRRK